MTDKTLVHITNKLYQADKLENCPNCDRQISETAKGETTLLDEEAKVKSSCNYCGHDVVVIFKRVKPFWVQLSTCGKNLKAESIQTCNERWCKKEFQLQTEKEHIQYDRAEEWHLPITCPYCYQEHWINLYELDEN